MQKSRFVIGVLLLASSACVKLDKRAEKVKYVTKAEAPASCSLLGEVEVSDQGFRGPGDIPQSLGELKTVMRNRTADLGGNFLVIDEMDTVKGENGSEYMGTGRAYKCPDGEAAQQAPAAAASEAAPAAPAAPASEPAPAAPASEPTPAAPTSEPAPAPASAAP